MASSLRALTDEINSSRLLFENWVLSQSGAIDSLWLTHETRLASSCEQIKKQEFREKTLISDAERCCNQLEKTASEVDAKNRETMLLKAQQQKLREEAATLQAGIASAKKEVDECLAVVTTGDTQRRYKTTELAKAVALYRDRLGVTLRRSGEGILSFVLTKVDRANPAREFVVSLRLNDNNEYEVVQCSPAVPDVAIRVRELNAAPDRFANFLAKVRAAWCSMC
eukprot:gnl/Spiro4/11106_TR5890_c0_g1_i1.p1 gnl/Spiro4/11106_TR5890_c0_g1~~gnl/Spiro4/11106_TR5890_c0_g1_i1.p1  ORF type:complete len:225 (-),score=63.40 gnl/Spiro4/11106_TR5890_c0_g1_i1:86-760(-)